MRNTRDRPRENRSVGRAGQMFVGGNKAQRSEANHSPNKYVGLESVGSFLALHCLEEFRIRLRVLHLVQQEFDGGEFVHGMQNFSQYPHLL